jgi:fucose 4-O-acetylase-like acetyltransferase
MNRQQTYTDERVAVFDALRGFAILLVIVANHAEGTLRTLIYSFHMPLFIFISGYLHREKGTRQAAVSGFRRLIVPCFAVCGVTVLWDLYTGYAEKDFLIPVKRIVSYILCTTADTEHFYSVGPVWLLFSLFWCRILYGIIDRRVHFFIGQMMMFSMSIVTVSLNGNVSAVPFCLMQGLNIVWLYNAGFLAREFGVLTAKVKVGTVAIACATMFTVLKFGGLNIENCTCGLYPGEIVNASLICFLLYKVFETGKGFAFGHLAVAGKHWLPILCVHTVVLLKLKPAPDINAYLLVAADVLLSVGIGLLLGKYAQNGLKYNLQN